MVATLAVVASALTIANSAKSLVSGSPKTDPSVLANQKKQEEALARQEAVEARDRIATDKRAEQLSAQAAAQRRAIRAGASTRGGLSYVSTKNLKTTLGG